MKYIASVSFGKDSLAMLICLIQKKLPLDEVVFFDTGMEFQAIYNLRNKIILLLKERGIKYTELKPSCDFCYKMFEMPVCVGKPNEHKGYSWCGGRCRWGTTEKLKALEKYCKGSIQYVGIAADEWKRLVDIFDFDMEEYVDKNGNIKKRPILSKNGCIQNFKQISNLNKRYPLVENSMTESECLKLCRDLGYGWREIQNHYVRNSIDLYDILDRVSCWCCGNKNLKELKNYYRFLPLYWERLKELQSKTDRPFKKPYTIFDLEKRFKEEL